MGSGNLRGQRCLQPPDSVVLVPEGWLQASSSSGRGPSWALGGARDWRPEERLRAAEEALELDTLATELKSLIIEALMLEDVTVDDIDTRERLFIEGLGLDSIDALELAMAIQRRYGVRIQAEDEETRAIFRSVETLAAHIHAQQREVSP